MFSICLKCFVAFNAISVIIPLYYFKKYIQWHFQLCKYYFGLLNFLYFFRRLILRDFSLLFNSPFMSGMVKSRGLNFSFRNWYDSRFLSKNLKFKIYKTIILPVVLYGCETWSLTLREECRLRVFENRILRQGFGPKRDG